MSNTYNIFSSTVGILLPITFICNSSGILNVSRFIFSNFLPICSITAESTKKPWHFLKFSTACFFLISSISFSFFTSPSFFLSQIQEMRMHKSITKNMIGAKVITKRLSFQLSRRNNLSFSVKWIYRSVNSDKSQAIPYMITTSSIVPSKLNIMQQKYNPRF